MTTSSTSSNTGGTFRSFRIPNFRRFYVGQLLSQCGTWMEQAALTWVVLGLTDSGVALGFVTAARLGPLILLGPGGAFVVNRIDRRRLMVITQIVMGVLATATAVLVTGDGVGTGAIYALSMATGVVMAVDNPTRRLLVQELVPRENLANATRLSSATTTVAKAVGPALAGLLIAGPGAKWCFVLNAAGYAVVVASLLSLDRWTIHETKTIARAKGQLRDGFRYVRRTADLFVPLTLVGVTSAFALVHAVTLPLLSARELDGDDTSFTWLLVTVSASSVVGALVVARRRRVDVGFLVGASSTVALATGVLAVVPSLPLAHVALVPVGLAAALLVSGASAVVRSVAEPAMRGRVMAVFTTVFLGSAALGSIAVGGIAELLGARAALAVGMTTTGLVSAWAAQRLYGVHDHEPATSAEELVRQLGGPDPGPDPDEVDEPDEPDDLVEDDASDETGRPDAVETAKTTGIRRLFTRAKRMRADSDVDSDDDPASSTTDEQPDTDADAPPSTDADEPSGTDGDADEPGVISLVTSRSRSEPTDRVDPADRADQLAAWTEARNGRGSTVFGGPSRPGRNGDSEVFSLQFGNPEALLNELRRSKAVVVRSRVRALRKLEAQISTAPDGIRDEIGDLPQREMLHAMATLHTDDGADEGACARLRPLAQLVLDLDDRIAQLDLQIEPLATQAEPSGSLT